MILKTPLVLLLLEVVWASSRLIALAKETSVSLLSGIVSVLQH